MDSFDQTTILWVAILIAILVFVAKGVKQVPQSKARIVERFGQYHRTLNAGLNFIVPFLDQVTDHELDLSETQLSIKDQKVTTIDNVRAEIDIEVFYRIVEPSKFVYRIERGERAIKVSIDATVRALVGRRTFDQLNADRLQLCTDIADEVKSVSSEWGVSMSRVEITDISAKDQEFVESMRLEAQSERERRGAVIKSQGEAQSIKLDAEAQAMRIRLEADAMLYKAEKEAEAIRITAEAQAWAIATKGAALETEGAKFAQQSEILRAQVDALHSIGSADNSKIVVVPADLIQSASSLISLTRKSGFN